MAARPAQGAGQRPPARRPARAIAGVFSDRAVDAALERAPATAARDHRHRLWPLLMLELWFRQFADRRAPRARPRGRLAVMCGIAGIVVARPAARRRRRAASCAMRDVIAHRGPDDAGPVRGRAGGARPSPPEHRRSRRRPAAAVERGRHDLDQSSTARSTTTRDLRPELEAHGHVYRTRSRHRDHRPRLRAVGRRLRRPPARHVRVRDLGRAARRLLLARDRLGIKPLYWTRRRRAPALRVGDQGASSRAGWSQPEANDAAIPELLEHALRSPASETLFQGIHKLLPGHVLTFEHGARHLRDATGTCRSVATRAGAGAVRRRGRRAASASCSRSRSGCG